METNYFPLFINGSFRESASGERFESIDPCHRRPWAMVADGTTDDIDQAVISARRALDGPWGTMGGPARAKLIRKLGELIARDAEELARLESRDGGKVFRDTLGQLRMIPDWFYYFAGLADKIEGRVIQTGKSNFFVHTQEQPIGVVAAITPWNAPLMLLASKLPVALAAGCTFIVKPSEHASVSTLAIARLVAEAGIPAGVFNAVAGSDRGLGAHLAGHSDIDKVLFTGSTATGRAVAQSAAYNLNGSILELGGKSPQIVFADATIESAIDGVVAGIFGAAGQSCMAGSRLIVHKSVADEFIERLAERADAVKVGDPQSEDTEMGPISNEVQFDTIARYLKTAEREGATILTGGVDAALGGLFIRPTVLTHVEPHMRVWREEIFGPVLSVVRFQDDEQAILLANDTEYGLSAGVWTKDLAKAHACAKLIRAGTVWINSYRAVAPGVPFAGVRASGLGSENGQASLRDFLSTKAVWMDIAGQKRDPFQMA